MAATGATSAPAGDSVKPSLLSGIPWLGTGVMAAMPSLSNNLRSLTCRPYPDFCEVFRDEDAIRTSDDRPNYGNPVASLRPLDTARVPNTNSSFKRSYEANLPTGDATKLGLHFSMVDDDLIVDGVLPGMLAAAWNNANPRFAQLMTGDRVLEVNGVRGSANVLLKEFKSDMQTKLKMQHPVLQRVVVHKRGRKVGILVSHNAKHNHAYLVVEYVGGGAIADYIRESCSCNVQKGDRIIEINGVRSSPADLLRELQTKDDLDMLIVPNPLATSWRD